MYSGDSYNQLHEEEISKLEQKANELAKELEECRKTVPLQIMENLKTQLESVRPKAELTEANQRENDAKVSVNSAANAEDLKDKLSSTCQKMPEIRAKIEEAVARTDRVIRAIEQEASKSGEETNLEELLQDDKKEDDVLASVSPALKRAEISGHVSSRKKWARLMTFSSPIKFSLKDAR